MVEEFSIHLPVEEFSLQIIEKVSERLCGKSLYTGYGEDHMILALCQVKL